jgi:hypothetical protein
MANDEASAEQLDKLADRLAREVEVAWTQVAADRGLLGAEAIPVLWRRASIPSSGKYRQRLHLGGFSPCQECPQ